MPIWPIGNGGERDDRSDQQEHHNQFGIFNDERKHASDSHCSAAGRHIPVAWSRLFVTSMTRGTISVPARINVSCITDECISLIQSERVKAFPPSLHPRQAFGGVFLSSDALNPVRKLQQ